jgi:RNA polymerase sigma-70 factor (ECF subfamily)
MAELSGATGEIEDDRLRPIFTCCQPALPREGRVALTLRFRPAVTEPRCAAA